jgi:dTDP-4-dehydrorhamnose 3,5-epimerase
MDVIATSLDGVWKIPLRRARDERGWFVRTFDAAAFAALGLNASWPEHGEAYNARAGTLRGLHFQREPHAETKLIRCTRGAVYDVLVDVRRDASSYGCWEGFELSEDGKFALYAPPGFAHGYQTLRDGSALHYLISEPYAPEAAAGFRYDSPLLAIPWPLPASVISERDAALPPFERSRVDP